MKHILISTLLFIASFICAQDTIDQESKLGKIYTELLFSIDHFEQQVKGEIGGVKGELLVDETNISFGAIGGYKVLPWLSAGLYLRYDSGKRFTGTFEGLDSDGQTIIGNRIGGDYSEMWLGPFARLSWQRLFLSLGYGLVGTRVDDSRADLPSTSGNITESFEIDPRVAWIFNIGASASLTGSLDAIFGLEYRARYYNKRGSDPLDGNIVFGTQNLTPLMGVAYSF